MKKEVNPLSLTRLYLSPSLRVTFIWDLIRQGVDEGVEGRGDVGRVVNTLSKELECGSLGGTCRLQVRHGERHQRTLPLGRTGSCGTMFDFIMEMSMIPSIGRDEPVPKPGGRSNRNKFTRYKNRRVTDSPGLGPTPGTVPSRLPSPRSWVPYSPPLVHSGHCGRIQ